MLRGNAVHFCLGVLLFYTSFPISVQADNASSSCNVRVVGNAATDCFTISLPDVNVAIDGTFADWPGNPEVRKNFQASSPNPGYIEFAKHDGNLFVHASINITNIPTVDSAALRIDSLHNHISVSDDFTFTIPRSPSSRIQVHKGTGTPADWICLGCYASTLTGVWEFEMKIPVSDLDQNDLPSIFGVSFEVLDNTATRLLGWPANFVVADGNTWSNIKSRYPIEYIIVLDQSGSMLATTTPGSTRWSEAVQAANLLANTMSLFSRPTYFDDQLGVFAYSWVGMDTTSEPKPLATIGNFPLGDYMAGTALPQPQNLTPIGKGLEHGFNKLNASSTSNTERVMMLLSDGLHNRPSSDVPLLPQSGMIGYAPCPIAWGGVCADANVKVHSVAFGSPGTVAEDLLANVATYFGGNATNYNIGANPELIKQAFIDSLSSLYQFESLTIAGPATDPQVVLNNDEQKLVVILSWDTPASAVPILLQRKNLSSDPWPTTNLTCRQSDVNTGVGYSICTFDDPLPGVWRAVTAAGSPIASATATPYMLVDLNLRARFKIDQQIHGTGKDVVLTADIREAGKPVTNSAAHKVDVRVKISRPGEGFGTFVSLHNGDDCETHVPSLPAIDPGLSKRLSTVTGRVMINNPAPSNVSSAISQSGDPKPARFAKMSRVFAACEKSQLDYVDSGEQLYDDGSHGDVTPNDGIYTLRFSNTQYEGSYIFHFTASGISPSNSEFSRTKTFAAYLRVEVDPSELHAGIREISRNEKQVVKEFHITPRDRFGGYLGPGHADQIRLQADSGKFIGPLIDYNNGIYSRLLSYDEDQNRPVVTPIVQGKTGPNILTCKAYSLSPIVGQFMFNSALNLDDAMLYGLKFSYTNNCKLLYELEANTTSSKDSLGVGGDVNQILFNVRYNIFNSTTGSYLPYVTGGLGSTQFSGFTNTDNAFTLQGGVGMSKALSERLGLRAEVRWVNIKDAYATGNTTSVQELVGLEFMF